MKKYRLYYLIVLLSAVIGCASLQAERHRIESFITPQQEEEWIRNGQPIEFDGVQWFPQDEVDILTDDEVELLGIYKGVQFFAQKVDVRPYNQLYTKFDTNKFRSYLQHDKTQAKFSAPVPVFKEKTVRYKHFGF